MLDLLLLSLPSPSPSMQALFPVKEKDAVVGNDDLFTRMLDSRLACTISPSLRSFLGGLEGGQDGLDGRFQIVFTL